MFKETSLLAAHYSNTYMEQFCQAIHPKLELGTICVSWFRQATKHCTGLLRNVSEPSFYFWTTVKNFIFPDRTTAITSPKTPISIHPQRLTINDCQTLLLDIVSDYVQRAPRYAAESASNGMLWHIFYSLMCVMTLGTLLVVLIFAYNKYEVKIPQINFLDEFFSSDKRKQAIARHSLNLAKTELRNIKIKPVAREEHILPPDGAQVFACHIKTKFELMDSTVIGQLPTVGKLYRLYDQYNKTKEDFKIESLKKAMKFLDNNCQKLHLVIMFEEGAEYDDEMEAKLRKSQSPRIKSLSPPPTPMAKLGLSSSKKQYRLEGGGNDQCTRSMAGGISSRSAGSNSPRKSTPVKRSGSGIPRNLPKIFSPSKISK